jgi:hypothetical protein
MATYYCTLLLSLVQLGSLLSSKSVNDTLLVRFDRKTRFDQRLRTSELIVSKDRRYQDSLVKKRSSVCSYKEYLDVRAYIILSTQLNLSVSSYTTNDEIELPCVVHTICPLIKSLPNDSILSIIGISKSIGSGEYASRLTKLGMSSKNIVVGSSNVRISSTGGSIRYPVTAEFVLVEALQGRHVFDMIKSLVNSYELRHNTSSVMCVLYNNNPSSAIVFPTSDTVYNMLCDDEFFDGLHALIQ